MCRSSAFVLFGIVLASCSPRPQAAKLRILCGSSMARPVAELKTLFAKQANVEIELTEGGSEDLLPKVLQNAPADIFVCHDPFEQTVKDAGKLAGSAAMGGLRPVIAVRPGNSRNIKGPADLAQADLKLGIPDPRYATCGEMFMSLLKRRGLEEGVRPNIKAELRKHDQLATALAAGSLDAVVIWNFAAVQFQDKLQVVDWGDDYEPVRVTILGLSQSPSPSVRDQFLAFCRTEQALEVFKKHGYGARP